MSIKAAQRELERRQNEAMRPLGLTGAQADALVVIGQAGPLSLNELGDLLIAEAGHPSRLVDRLVEAGFVERRASTGRPPARRALPDPARAPAAEAHPRLARERAGAGPRGRWRPRPRADLEAVPRGLQVTPFAELIERRRELEDRSG